MHGQVSVMINRQTPTKTRWEKESCVSLLVWVFLFIYLSTYLFIYLFHNEIILEKVGKIIDCIHIDSCVI